MAAAPVVMLASGITISRVAPHASRRVEGQWGGAGGASIEEEHAGVRLENQYDKKGACLLASVLQAAFASMLLMLALARRLGRDV